MDEGIILKALSGFYYVYDGTGDLVTCRARGKFRHQKITPLRIGHHAPGVLGQKGHDVVLRLGQACSKDAKISL